MPASEDTNGMPGVWLCQLSMWAPNRCDMPWITSNASVVLGTKWLIAIARVGSWAATAAALAKHRAKVVVEVITLFSLIQCIPSADLYSVDLYSVERRDQQNSRLGCRGGGCEGHERYDLDTQIMHSGLND